MRRPIKLQTKQADMDKRPKFKYRNSLNINGVRYNRYNIERDGEDDCVAVRVQVSYLVVQETEISDYFENMLSKFSRVYQESVQSIINIVDDKFPGRRPDIFVCRISDEEGEGEPVTLVTEAFIIESEDETAEGDLAVEKEKNDAQADVVRNAINALQRINLTNRLVNQEISDSASGLSRSLAASLGADIRAIKHLA